jgi:metallophosphoesterase (TIGR00282 family)
VKILMIGDIVGGPGRRVVGQVVPRWRAEERVDFVVANAENAAGGRGVSATIAEDLLSNGIDVITLGDHTWDQRDLAAFLDRESRIVRPLNFAPGCPGRGATTVDGPGGRVTVISAIGRVFMKPYDCPFRAVTGLLDRTAPGGIILVDFHAEATSEKIVFGRYFDGRVSAVVGTHTHVQTADDRVLPKGTAYITDLGMTGPRDSAIGRELEGVTTSMLSGMPSKFEVAGNDVGLEGVLIDVDESTGKARRIKRIREPMA